MLHEEQNYVFEIARELGAETKLIHHSRTTISCREKLELLKEENLKEFSEWTLDRIVKALYFSRNGLPFLGVITPEFERNIKSKDIFSGALGMPKGKAERYWIDPNHVPRGMSWGTCTPFPLIASVGTEISDLIIIDHNPVKNKLVNISIGGTGEGALRTSMHLPYQLIYEILKKTFGDRVHFFNYP